MGSIVKHIINIDKMMKNNNLKNTVVFRGVNGIDLNRFPVLVNKAFTSTSTNKIIANQFSGDDCCIIRFTIPDNIKTILFEYNKNTSAALKEDEILIERNTQFVDIKPSPIPKVFDAILKKYSPPNVQQDLQHQEQILEYRRQQIANMVLDDLDFDDSDFED